MEINEKQVAEFKKLLDKFNKEFPPKPVYEPTYLELCEYPWTRREEICSRLFAFFFDTRNPHGFGTLFFKTLLEVYQEKYPNEERDLDKKNFLYTRNVYAETEVYTEDGNRIDLLLTTDCLKVCVENKIDAPADNDFNDYCDYVEKESKRFDLLPVCILFALREKGEYEGVKLTSNFKTIYYREFLEKLKQNLGDCLTQCNPKYLSVLTDFILFLDRKGGFMSDFSKEEKDFFLNNNIIIDRLIARRDQFRAEQRDEKNKHIGIIKDLLAKKDAGFCNFMKEESWGGERYLLGRFDENNPKYELGIEAGFADGLFNISLTIWLWDGQKQRIELYEPLIGKRFNNPKKTHEPPKNKWSAIVRSIDENNDEQIVNGLYEVYEEAKEIVDEAKNCANKST